ncbi:type II secretion system F family protein [Pararhizobium haloflavum]|uniref:type II secretion system F family protein n=1 Tax=Pararhizobium haloflavum TaxID=2037914 RepID=UPI000C17EF95|nr:type II secretion system F family protein [Pararhizobium haloflavum]
MAGIDLNIIAIGALVAISVAAVAYSLLYSRFENAKKAEARLNRVRAAETDQNAVRVARDRVNEASKRRRTVENSLKDLEEKQKQANKQTKSPPLKVLLAQAGLKIAPRQFYLIGVAFGLIFTFVVFAAGMPLLLCLGVFFVAAFGIPRWVVAYLRSKRMKAFLNEFPNALDVMVRSIKSGLPLNDSIRLIAAEAQEPVKSEFRRIVEAQQLGMSVPEACTRLHQGIPLPEASFFAIVIAIQAQAGGNLSEALGNLSRVLRDRRKMKAKVQALSMEAKASAVIIGALPFIVAVLVYLTSPDYMTVLFTDPRGQFILGVSGFWMSIGIFVMRNMINFEI